MSEKKSCLNCAYYRAKIASLQAENNHLKRVIARTASLAYQTAADSANRLQGHLPRAEWSYHKGRGETAGAIYRRLQL